MSYNELRQHGTADFPIELYQIDKTHPKYEMASHWHSSLEIIRVISGSLQLRLNNQEYLAGAGDIIFVNSETVHGAEPYDCVYECIVFHMDSLTIPDNSSKLFVDSLLNHEYLVNEMHGAGDTDFHNAVNALFSAMKSKEEAGYQFFVMAALYQMLGTIISLGLYTAAEKLPYITGDKNIPKLKKVLTYIRSHYDTQITLNDMADAVGMSPKYFCFFFRDMTKKTPVEYLNSYRIERAARKLLNSDMSVTEISYACGFNDLSYFIKSFKKLKGITPAKFRKLYY